MLNTAASQTLKWSTSERYDDGKHSSVAAHPSGLVLEAHHTHAFLGIDNWYHLGVVNGTSVTWGGSQRLPGKGVQNWPNVAITKEGYVVFVYSLGDNKRGAELYYAVGEINPYGGTDQSITWLTNTNIGTFIDSGFHSSIAINENGVILLAFESGSSGNGLYYRVGHLSNPARGDYTIQWDSGQYGVHYDAGINPHIALNNLNEVVEVHQASSKDELLHYRRGTVSRGTINFGGSQRYDSAAVDPAVSLLDNGLVVELHSPYGDTIENRPLYARTRTLNPSNPEKIDWSGSAKIGNDDRYEFDPAVASNGSYVIGTWQAVNSNPLLLGGDNSLKSSRTREAVRTQSSQKQNR